MRSSLSLLALIVLVVLTLYIAYNMIQEKKVVIKASTTTSLYVTGLLDKLASEFRRKHPEVEIMFIPTGSGAALEVASKGDVDLVFVHAPLLEKRYLEKGIIIKGGIFAYNYFIIVGPKDDPAGIRGLRDAIKAFRKIYMAGQNGKILFISRGDKSGTHVRELMIWNRTGLNPKGKAWYKESGLGMAKTLLVAENLEAYTLSDISTFLKLKREGRLKELEVLVSEDPILINIYSVYIVNPEKFEVNWKYAKSFVDFILSSEGQHIIANYGKEEYGIALFKSTIGVRAKLENLWRMLSEVD